MSPYRDPSVPARRSLWSVVRRHFEPELVATAALASVASVVSIAAAAFRATVSDSWGDAYGRGFLTVAACGLATAFLASIGTFDRAAAAIREWRGE